jgi:hypothetical protein
LWNYTDVAENLVLTFYFSGGHYRIPVHIEARRAYNLDMMKLVHSRVPDPDGNLIPSNISSGSALLSGTRDNLQPISVASTSSVYNVRNATCFPICHSCNSVSEGAYIDPTSIGINGPQSVQATASVTLNTGGTASCNATWSSLATAVATVSSSGLVTGVAPGSGTIEVNCGDVPIPGTMCASGPCPMIAVFGLAPVTVQPVCFAELKYRNAVGGLATHAFWYIQDSTGLQSIIDGGPSGSCLPTPAYCGYLVDWITSSTPPVLPVTSQYPADNTSAGTWWSSGPPANGVCDQVDSLLYFAQDWSLNTISYNPLGPNSNTFAEEAGAFANWYPSAPPGAVGW